MAQLLTFCRFYLSQYGHLEKKCCPPLVYTFKICPTHYLKCRHCGFWDNFRTKPLCVCVCLCTCFCYLWGPILINTDLVRTCGPHGHQKPNLMWQNVISDILVRVTAMVWIEVRFKLGFHMNWLGLGLEWRFFEKVVHNGWKSMQCVYRDDCTNQFMCVNTSSL